MGLIVASDRTRLLLLLTSYLEELKAVGLMDDTTAQVLAEGFARLPDRALVAQALELLAGGDKERLYGLVHPGFGNRRDPQTDEGRLWRLIRTL